MRLAAAVARVPLGWVWLGAALGAPRRYMYGPGWGRCIPCSPPGHGVGRARRARGRPPCLCSPIAGDGGAHAGAARPSASSSMLALTTEPTIADAWCPAALGSRARQATTVAMPPHLLVSWLRPRPP